jgi:hypothetical protein
MLIYHILELKYTAYHDDNSQNYKHNISCLFLALNLVSTPYITRRRKDDKTYLLQDFSQDFGARDK